MLQEILSFFIEESIKSFIIKLKRTGLADLPMAEPFRCLKIVFSVKLLVSNKELIIRENKSHLISVKINLQDFFMISVTNIFGIFVNKEKTSNEI